MESSNVNASITVLIQVAQLAQARGVLSLDDAVVVKRAIDSLSDFVSQDSVKPEEEEG
jgi:hypothetical protein